MRLVFHRPNKCTESQYVFSSAVQPGHIIEGCLRLDEAQEREGEKELAMKCVPDELSRSGVLEETQHVQYLMRHWSWDVPFSRSSPSPPFPAESADLSEEKIDLHVPSELYNFCHG